MHILIVTYGLPSKQNPMMGIFEWDQARALCANGVEVDYFAVDLRSFRRFRPWGISHGKRDGVRWHVISIPVGNVPRSIFSKIGVFALRLLYQSVFGNGSCTPDIIHAHFTTNGYMAAVVAREEGIPLIITEHSSEMHKVIISSQLKRIAEYGYNSADCVLCVGSSLRNAIYQHTGVVARVVPNCVSSLFHLGVRVHHGFRFISVSNLIPGKRIDVLLRAFAQLYNRFNDIIIEVVGDGKERQALEKLAQELHISHKVVFHGLMKREDIATLYMMCDCFVLPSAAETFGVAYIEAMAAGLPVIATRCGGPEDFVTDENGILVNVDDVEALKDAMLYMYNSHGKYDSRLISQKTIDRFSPDVIARQLVGIYDEILRDSFKRKRE